MKLKTLFLSLLAVSGIAGAQNIDLNSIKQLPGGVIAVPLQSPENGIGYSHEFPEGTQKASPYDCSSGFCRDGYKGWKHYDVAIKIDHQAFDGCKLLGVCAYYFGEEGDVKMWTSSKLWNDKADIEIVPAVRWGATYECVFENPVTLHAGTPVYTGYSLDIPGEEGDPEGGAVGHSVSAGKEPGGLYLKQDEGDGPWVDMSKKWGNATIWIYLMPGETSTLYGLDVAQPTLPKRVATGDSIDVSIPVTNIGAMIPEVMEYEYDLNNNHYTASIDLPKEYGLTAGNSAEVMVHLAPATQPGEYPLTIKVTKVNGHDNPSTKAECTGLLHVFVPAETILPEGSIPAEMFNGRDLTNLGNSKLLGNVSAATKINIPEIEGMKIVGAKVKNIATKEVNNHCMWLSSKLDTVPDGEIVYNLPYNGDLTVLFTNPVEMPKGGIYAGYSFNILKTNEQNRYPFHASQPKTLSKSLFLNTGGAEGWTDYSNYGTLELTLYVQGEFNKDAVKVKDYSGNLIFMEGQPVIVNVVVSNTGRNVVKSLEINYDYDGATGTKKVELEEALPVGIGKDFPLTFNIDGIEKTGNINGKITIAKVNDQANTCAENAITIPTILVNWMPVKRPLMEEGTGLGCGWCPRGTLALSLMGKKYPEFIAAAYHRYNAAPDPMKIKVNLPWNSDYGFPTSSIDRGPDIDPMTGTHHRTMGIEEDYLDACKNAGTATLDMTTSWNEDTTKLTVNTTAVFAYVENGKKYKLGYILLTDSLSHPDDPEWKQNNSYEYSGSDYKDDPILYTLVDGSFDLTVYNHVVISTDGYKGVTGSVPADVAQGSEVKHQHVFDVTGNDLVEEPAQVKVIVVLLDEKNHVCNAREVRAGETTIPDPVGPYVGINNIVNNIQTPDTWYNIQGQRVENPHSGIFIHVSGGKATKVIK